MARAGASVGKQNGSRSHDGTTRSVAVARPRSPDARSPTRPGRPNQASPRPGLERPPPTHPADVPRTHIHPHEPAAAVADGQKHVLISGKTRRFHGTFSRTSRKRPRNAAQGSPNLHYPAPVVSSRGAHACAGKRRISPPPPILGPPGASFASGARNRRRPGAVHRFPHG